MRTQDIREHLIHYLTTAFPHPHRLCNENKKRKITRWHTVGGFLPVEWNT